MATFDFPSSPSVGQQYAPSGGPTYQWDGSAWKAVPAALTAETRNRLVNPCFQVSQENGDTAWTITGVYAADQWVLSTIHSAGTITTQRVQSVTPNGSLNRLRVTITAADASLAAGEFLYWWSSVEGGRMADFRYGSASAKQSILRFGFKGPAGTYSISVQNSAGNRSYIANFTISGGQANTDTTQTFVIPGDATGTWQTGTNAGMYLYVTLAVGTTSQGALGWSATGAVGTASNSNGMGTAGAVFELFDVGLYLDPQATGVAPAWAMPDEAEELRACQRYYQNNIYGLFSGYATNAFTFYALYTLVVPMRTTPSVSGVNTGASGFPTTVGTFTPVGVNVVREGRISNASTDGATFASTIAASARM